MGKRGKSEDDRHGNDGGSVRFDTVALGAHRICVADLGDGTRAACLSHLAAAGFGMPVSLNKATARYGREGTLRILGMPSGPGYVRAWFCSRAFLEEWLARLEAQKSMPSMRHDLDGVIARAEGVARCIGAYDGAMANLDRLRPEGALPERHALRDAAAALEDPRPARVKDEGLRMLALAMLLGVREPGRDPVYSVADDVLGSPYRHVCREDWVSFFTEFRDRYPEPDLDPAALAEQCANIWDFTGGVPDGSMGAERLFFNAVHRP